MITATPSEASLVKECWVGEDWIQEGSKVLQRLLANQQSQRGFLHGLWEEEGCTRLTCQAA